MTATYLQRHYKCQECNHTFIEKNPYVCCYLRLSKTNMEYLFRQLGEKGSFTEISKRSDISASTVIRYFSKLAIPKPNQLPTVLGIDEYKGNTEGQMYPSYHNRFNQSFYRRHFTKTGYMSSYSILQNLF